jgi:thiosulfate/3-mercaptopyruvate sulfurtransferase
LATNSVSNENYRHPSILVSTDWLINNYNDPSLVIFHVGGKKSFDSAHIPGAEYLSLMDLMVMEDAGGLLHEIAPVEQITARLKELGVTDGSTIILYHEGDRFLPHTTRIFLTLDVLGIGKSVSILDGGFKHWKLVNHVPQQKRSVLKNGQLTVNPQNNILVDTKWMSENFSRPAVVLIDGRPEDHYLGKSNPHNFPPAGHIQGSFTIPFYSLVKEDATHFFKEPEKLQPIFADIGVQEGSIVLTYCNTGFWAPQVYFIAKYLRYDVRFYDASFQQWSEDENLPVIGQANIGL